MKNKSSWIIWVVLAVIVLGGLTYWVSRPDPLIGAYDSFGQCLSDKGVKFYGAFWCPHCQAQKRALHESTKLPYIECANPSGSGPQNKVCDDANVQSYPTWVYPDGTRDVGEQTVLELSTKSGCAIPAGVTN